MVVFGDLTSAQPLNEHTINAMVFSCLDILQLSAVVLIVGASFGELINNL